MGALIYDDTERPILIDDRTLAHLKVVIATKLRRQESFTLSWRHPAGQPVGRTTIWLHPSIPLQFVFEESEPPELDPAWLERIMRSVSDTGEIHVAEEGLPRTQPVTE